MNALETFKLEDDAERTQEARSQQRMVIPAGLPERVESGIGAGGVEWAESFYRDSLVTIINADSRDVMPKLPRGLVVTDPPYNVGYHYDGYADNLPDAEYRAMLRETCPQPCVILHYAEDLVAMAMTLGAVPDKMVAWVYNSMNARQWRGLAWWGCKPDFEKAGQEYKNPADKRIRERIERGEEARLYDWWEVQQVKNVSEEKSEHPCQIPTEVMRRILKITDCQLVIDPFAGAGTTLLAAKQLGIPSIGIERNPKYCAIAAQRCAAEFAFGPLGGGGWGVSLTASGTKDCGYNDRAQRQSPAPPTP